MILLLRSSHPHLRRATTIGNYGCRRRDVGSLASSYAMKSKKTPIKNIFSNSFLFGTFAGVTGSLAGGVGGAFAMVPVLTSRIFRLSRTQAHGTSLCIVSATGIAGTVAYSDYVNYEAAAIIAICGMTTAGSGAAVASHFSRPILRKAWGIFMVSVASIFPATEFILLKQEEEHPHQKSLQLKAKAETGKPDTQKNISIPDQADDNIGYAKLQRVVVPAGIGACSGFLAGLLRIGSGAVVVPALALATDMKYHEIVGTSLFSLVIPAVTGAVTHCARGTVAMRLAPMLTFGAFAGGLLGGSLGVWLTEEKLKRIFASWTGVIGLRSLLL